MSLIAEDGTGIAGAEAYSSIDAADAYWLKRAHDPLAAAWATGTLANKEGAMREAADFLDATAGPYYRGVRSGFVQGREFPRTDAFDETGFYPLPDLPAVLSGANIALAARAISARLSEDADTNAAIKSTMDKVGPIATSVEYWGGGDKEQKFGTVLKSLTPILDGNEPWNTGAGNSSWAWA